MSIKRRKRIYEIIIKRLIDFFVSLVSIIILLPLLILLAILVRIKLGSPIIFRQMRPGKNEKVFNMYKFRSMTNEEDEHGDLLPDENRLTKFGKALRELSLDELPQLFNILKGDMSLVGPRPQLVENMWFMSDEQRIRHSVRGGLTGLAQVNGRNIITWEERIQFDLMYAKNISFLGDLKILFSTVRIVFKRTGVSQTGMDTAESLGSYLLRTNQINQDEYVQIILRNNNES